MWFNRVNNSNIARSNVQIAFNDILYFEQLTDHQIHRLHLFIILLKQYFYSYKCLEKKKIQQEFQNKVILQWKLDNTALPSFSKLLISCIINIYK